MRENRETQAWTEQTLFPPDVLEFTLKIGVVVSGDHAQIQYEVRDPSSGELVRMESHHHMDLRAAADYLKSYVAELYLDLHKVVYPFR